MVTSLRRPKPWRERLSTGGPAAAAVASAACAIAGTIEAIPFPDWLAIVTGCVALAYPVLVVGRSRMSRERSNVVVREREEFRRKLDRDPLTNLLSRGAFNTALERLGKVNSHCTSVIVLFFDLDRFKDVNDTIGHKAGDSLLIEAARRAESVLPGAVALARLGGDEFAAIMRFPPSQRPEDYGHALVEVMQEPFLIEGCTVEVAASVGIAVGDALLDDGHELLRRADAAMYEAKGSARGRCRLYDDVLSERQMRESSIRVEIGKSMLEQAFELHYQPIVDARTGRFASAEALLRSKSPELSDVSIAKVISVAEASGQIIPLTDWTLDAALEAIKVLESSSVSVNISPVYFRRHDFVHRLFDKLLSSKTRPELLTVEVTEGVLIADIEAARNSISRLREIGVKVFLDDFGTGYSSLSYLQHFDLDGLKLDKSFLREVGDKRKATQIIRSIIDFGHSLDLRVVVEGVENDWQARLLQLLGCDLLQGYELGVPMPLPALLKLRGQELLAQPAPLEPANEAAHRPGRLRAAS